MIVTLVVYLCTTAAHTDCEVYAHSRYEGRNASMQCETVRDILLNGKVEPKRTVLSCEVDSAVAGQ